MPAQPHKCHGSATPLSDASLILSQAKAVWLAQDLTHLFDDVGIDGSAYEEGAYCFTYCFMYCFMYC